MTRNYNIIDNLTEYGLIHLYERWSGEFYAAQFIDPSQDNVKDFMAWIKGESYHSVQEHTDYEQAMLDEYERQE